MYTLMKTLWTSLKQKLYRIGWIWIIGFTIRPNTNSVQIRCNNVIENLKCKKQFRFSKFNTETMNNICRRNVCRRSVHRRVVVIPFAAWSLVAGGCLAASNADTVAQAIGEAIIIWRDLAATNSHPWSQEAEENAGSTTIRLRTFPLRHFINRHFIYRHFVYYCTPASRTVIHPTSVSANHYFHQFLLLLTLWFLFINPTSTDTMIIQHMQLASIVAWQSSLFFQLNTLIFINPTYG